MHIVKIADKLHQVTMWGDYLARSVTCRGKKHAGEENIHYD